jgi:hypothetical protein
MTLLYVVVYSALAFVLLRCGLVATIVAVFFANSGNTVLLGSDGTTWYIAIAVWAFWRSLGGRELIGEEAV